MLGAGIVAFIQPLAILGASQPVSAQTPIQPAYLKQIPPVAPMEPTTLVEQPEAPPYVPPPPLIMPYGTYGSTYAWGNCTAYVASRINVPNNLGNANTWAERAQADGYQLGPPIVGAVAQSYAGYYGHVAIVEAVGPGTVTVSEMNVYGLDVIDTAVYPVSHFQNYIYFR